MKTKSAILLVVSLFVALASLFVSPVKAEPEPVTLSASDATVAPGAAEAVIVVTVGNISAEDGLCACAFHASVDGGASIKSIKALVPGTGVKAEDSFAWASDDGIFDPSFELAEITVELPSDAAHGDEYNVTLIADEDPDNYLSYSDDADFMIGLGATVVRNGRIDVETAPILVYGPDKLTAGPGETKFEVCVSDIPTRIGVGSALVTVNVPGAAIKEVSILLSGETRISDLGGESVTFYWNGGADVGIYENGTAIAEITVEIPTEADGKDIPIELVPGSEPGDFMSFGAIGDNRIALDANAYAGGVIQVYLAFTPGDVNNDGSINARDVVLAMKASLPGFKEPSDFVFKAADMDDSGKINARDVIAVMKAALQSL